MFFKSNMLISEETSVSGFVMVTDGFFDENKDERG